MIRFTSETVKRFCCEFCVEARFFQYSILFFCRNVSYSLISLILIPVMFLFSAFLNEEHTQLEHLLPFVAPRARKSNLIVFHRKLTFYSGMKLNTTICFFKIRRRGRFSSLLS